MAVVNHPGDVVAVWELRLSDGIHRVQFEHGTTSGKRVITVDGKEVGCQGSGSARDMYLYLHDIICLTLHWLSVLQ